MTDIPLENALLLWDSDFKGGGRFAVRPLGHGDYWRFDCQGGACWTAWREADPATRLTLLAEKLLDIVANYHLPWSMIDDVMRVVPEYRAYMERFQ